MMREMNDTELRISGIEALYKALGPTATLRFLSLVQHEPTDYVEKICSICMQPLVALC